MPNSAPEKNNAPISAAEFDAVQRLIADSLSADRIAAARMVLLDGFSNQQAAEHFGVTRQAVWKSVDRVRETLLAYREAREIEQFAAARVLPRGWRRVTVSAPSAIVERFEAEAEAAYQARLNQVAQAEAVVRAQALRDAKK